MPNEEGFYKKLGFLYKSQSLVESIAMNTGMWSQKANEEWIV